VSRSIPIQVILMTPAFRRVGARLEEVSRMCGATKWRTLARITAPVLMPAILPLMVLSIIQGLQSIDVELIVGIPAGIYVFSTRIYDLAHENPPLYGAATALGAAVLFVLVGMVFIYNRVLSKREFTTVGSDFSSSKVDLGRFRWVASSLCMVLLAIGVGLPCVAAILGSGMRRFGFFNIANAFTSQHWYDVFHDPLFLSSMRNSALLGVLTAVASMLLYGAVAHASLRGKGTAAKLMNFFVWLPRGIPAVLLSLALLWLFLTTPLRTVLYGTVLGMVLAFVIVELPSRVQLAKSALIQIGRELEEASRMCGATSARTGLRVLLPLMAPMLLTIGALSFAAALSEFNSIVLIYSTATRPLSILTLEYIGNGDLERAAVLGTFMAAIVACLALCVRWLGTRLGPR
jgi:iron(III) transport system permease protein